MKSPKSASAHSNKKCAAGLGGYSLHLKNTTPVVPAAHNTALSGFYTEHKSSQPPQNANQLLTHAVNSQLRSTSCKKAYSVRYRQTKQGLATSAVCQCILIICKSPFSLVNFLDSGLNMPAVMLHVQWVSHSSQSQVGNLHHVHTTFCVLMQNARV